MWEALTNHPVRTTKNLLSLDGFQGVLGKHQGHTQFQRMKLPVFNSTANLRKGYDSIVFFEDQGSTKSYKIYVTPKNEHGGADDSWKVIWLDTTVKQIEAQTTGLNGTSGLIRGKKLFGLRVESGAFSAVWDRLKPGIDKPDTKQTKYLYELQPLPNGTDASTLTAWSEKAAWNIKPIKLNQWERSNGLWVVIMRNHRC